MQANYSPIHDGLWRRLSLILAIFVPSWLRFCQSNILRGSKRGGRAIWIETRFKMLLYVSCNDVMGSIGRPNSHLHIAIFWYTGYEFKWSTQADTSDQSQEKSTNLSDKGGLARSALRAERDNTSILYPFIICNDSTLFAVTRDNNGELRGRARNARFIEKLFFDANAYNQNVWRGDNNAKD